MKTATETKFPYICYEPKYDDYVLVCSHAEYAEYPTLAFTYSLSTGKFSFIRLAKLIRYDFNYPTI